MPAKAVFLASLVKEKAFLVKSSFAWGGATGGMGTNRHLKNS